MQQWLPLSTTTFQAVIDVIPSPADAQALRLAHMLHPEEARAASSSAPLQPANDLEKALFSCDQAEGAQVTAYVSKMFAVDRGDLPQYRPKELSAEEMRQRGREERERRAAALASSQAGAGADGATPSATEANSGKPLTTDDLSKPLESLSLNANANVEATANDNEPSSEPESSEILLGFSRIFSGVLKRDTPLLATLPKFDPDLAPTHPRNTKYVTRVTARDLYMMMGRELVAVDEVPAGHVCAIGGLEGKVFRNATLWAPDAEGIKIDEIPKTMINLAGVSMQVGDIVIRSEVIR
jgi:ribosome assembly protein 1